MSEALPAIPDAALFAGSAYASPPGRPAGLLERLLPTLSFYVYSMGIVHRSLKPAEMGLYDDERWCADSRGVVRALERVGGRLEVEGLDHIRGLAEPCLFVGNHMSTLETFILPAMIQPWKPVTFVVKRSLITYPFFGPIMRSRDPVVVDRANPRDDLRAVLAGGLARLRRGVSIVVFPQSTRMTRFDPRQFNSIGVKLARAARAPIIPLALCTDFWSNGTMLKDFGLIYPDRVARFRFGAPMRVEGSGRREHETIVGFIQSSLERWRNPPFSSGIGTGPRTEER
jgi:1-acyl-sn-glycerol-3-phosphate acyltransferase